MLYSDLKWQVWQNNLGILLCAGVRKGVSSLVVFSFWIFSPPSTCPHPQMTHKGSTVEPHYNKIDSYIQNPSYNMKSVPHNKLSQCF